MIGESSKDQIALKYKIFDEGVRKFAPVFRIYNAINLTVITAGLVATYLGFTKVFLIGALLSIGFVMFLSVLILFWKWDIHNRIQKTDDDISQNFTSPNTIINQEIGAIQQAKNIELWSRIVNGEEISYEDALEEIMPVIQKAIKERRRGVNLDNY